MRSLAHASFFVQSCRLSDQDFRNPDAFINFADQNTSTRVSPEPCRIRSQFRTTVIHKGGGLRLRRSDWHRGLVLPFNLVRLPQCQDGHGRCERTLSLLLVLQCPKLFRTQPGNYYFLQRRDGADMVGYQDWVNSAAGAPRDRSQPFWGIDFFSRTS
jgi:hypothetical protein